MKIVKLGDVCEVIAGQSPVGSSYNENGNGIEFHQGKKLFGSDLLKQSSIFTSRPAKLAEAGDILMSVRAPVGPINHLDRKICIGRGLASIRPSEKISKDYLFYFLRLNEENINGRQGATFASINKTEIETLFLPLPSLEEQRRVVERLDAAFEKIDRAIELTEKNIRFDKAVYDNKLASIFDPGNKWAMHELASLGTITSSKRIYKSEYKKVGVPFYRTKEIKELANNKIITTELYISSQRYIELKEKFGVPVHGDLLVTAIGTIGEVYVVEGRSDFYFKDGNVLWLKDFTTINPYYLKYALQRFVSELNGLSNGSAYNALPIQKLKAYKIPVPSERDQVGIVAQLDNLWEQTNMIQYLHIKKLENLNLLKQSLLTQAFSQSEVE